VPGQSARSVAVISYVSTSTASRFTSVRLRLTQRQLLLAGDAVDSHVLDRVKTAG